MIKTCNEKDMWVEQFTTTRTRWNRMYSLPYTVSRNAYTFVKPGIKVDFSLPLDIVMQCFDIEAMRLYCEGFTTWRPEEIIDYWWHRFNKGFAYENLFKEQMEAEGHTVKLVKGMLDYDAILDNQRVEIKSSSYACFDNYKYPVYYFNHTTERFELWIR